MITEHSLPKETNATGNPSHPHSVSRRQFMVAGGVAATAFTIVPRHVLGGTGFVAPSEKITLTCIGFGTQAIREIGGILASPDVQIVAMCDVEKDGVNYLEWGKNEIRDTLRRVMDNPTWREGFNHVPGGRDVGKELVEGLGLLVEDEELALFVVKQLVNGAGDISEGIKLVLFAVP